MRKRGKLYVSFPHQGLDAGPVELEGDRRKNMTTEELLKAFRVETDRMLFSAE